MKQLNEVTMVTVAMVIFNSPTWDDNPQPRNNYIDLAWTKSEALDDNYSLLKQNMRSCNAEGDVTRNDSQRRFLAQHRVQML